MAAFCRDPSCTQAEESNHVSTEPTLLRDVIDIPTVVHQGDLVFRLADAAAHADETVRNYVVTPQLETAFADAVGLVRSAVQDRSSKAAYLNGSFGSGKSNFMGMLQLLLDGSVAARSVPELAPVVENLNQWTGDQKFLTVPFHLIGEKDLESAVFGQYVQHIQRVLPDAPPPAVYANEPLLQNADDLRSKMGDAEFFAGLSAGTTTDSGWGDLAVPWNAESYELARHAEHSNEDRIRLVQALMSTWLTAFADGARANRSGYVSFGDGLAAISQHAKSLGYAGVILFLDELILWFMSNLADNAWVTAQASKLSKLVEAETASRPIPIISIIAKQRDLRNLVDESVPGDHKAGFVDQLNYQEGRFTTIKLDDSNLPVVAHRRLLQPIDAAAAAILTQAFTSLSLSPTVRDALLAETGNDASFALTYPFSPAFMTVLVDVSGALQRTRTGLRVLLDLLVRRRDELLVGQLVPVGDLWDVISGADEPFSDAMRSAFDQAKKLYDNSLRPELLDIHGLALTADPSIGFLNDDRLVKTLLLAALVPQSVPFKDLTVARLVALNHGLIASPVPGQETLIVVDKLRKLGSRVGALRVGTDAHNPTVSIVLSEVDTGAILASAQAVDNMASRRTLIKDLVLGGLGLRSDQLLHTHLWNGIRRDVAVAFGNIRDPDDLADNTFANDGPSWKLVIDFPFDHPGRTPSEDLARLDAFRGAGRSWMTVCWLPSFFTSETIATLSRLVRLNYILANDDRFNEATSSLTPIVRASAKPQLDAMQREARSQIDAAIAMAYGVINADPRIVDATHSLAEHFPSLRTGLAIRPPTRPNLSDALDEVLDQALRHSYPGSPMIESEIKIAEVKKIAEICRDAVVEPGGRLVVNDGSDRRLLVRIANPLELGVQSEQAFKLQQRSDVWDGVFTRAINQARLTSDPVVNVGVLRAAIDEPLPRGLTRPLENLIIIVWAQATNHTFRDHGGPAASSVDRLDDTWEVVEQALPDVDDWAEACERLGAIFGVKLPTTQLSGFALESAGARIREITVAHRSSVDRLLDRLGDWTVALGLGDRNDRLDAARCACDLIDSLETADDDLARVEALTMAAVRPSTLALGRGITSANDITRELDAAQRDIILAAGARAQGAGLLVELRTAFVANEFVTPLAPVLHSVQQRAVAMLAGASPTPSTAPLPPSHRVVTVSGFAAAQSELARLQATLGEDADVSVTIEWHDGNDS